MHEVVAPPRSRIREVDGLRGLAIVMVLCWHYLAILIRGPSRSLASALSISLRLAWSGVDLFFVLSGFLIGGILLDEQRSGRFFSTFYRRRFFRIVPLYAVVCAAFWIGVSLGGARWRGAGGAALFGDPLPWWSFPLFLQNVSIAVRGTFEPLPTGVTWSLAIEEQFYLTLPLLVRYLSRRRLVQVLAAAAVGAPLLRAALFYGVPHGGVAAYVLMPARADALIAGVFVAMVMRSPAARALVERRRGTFVGATCLLASGALALIPLGCTDNSSALMSIAGYSWLAAFYALVLLLGISRPSSLLAGALRAGWLRATGEIAYGTYLLHEAVIGLCFAVVFASPPRVANRGEALTMLLAAVATIALARLSWSKFESKMVRIGQRRGYERDRVEVRDGRPVLREDRVG